jgi:hypothetical protein
LTLIGPTVSDDRATLAAGSSEPFRFDASAHGAQCLGQAPTALVVTEKRQGRSMV